MNLSFFEWKPQHEASPAALDEASATTLVFLHGMGGTGSIWRPITAPLEETYRCIAPDQRGHGGSRPVPENERDDFHATDYAKDVSQLLASLKIDRYFLIGHSMGVRTALALAQQELEKVQGLILVDISITREWGGGIGVPLANFIRALPEQFSTRQGLRDYVMKYCPDPSIGQYLAAVSKKVSDSPESWVFPFDHQSLVRTIEEADEAPIPEWVRKILAAKIPILFLRGERSKVWKKEDYEAQRIQFADPNLTFEEWGNCGHGLPFEQRLRFIERVKEFIARE